jgi:hypothetical protein
MPLEPVPCGGAARRSRLVHHYGGFWPPSFARVNLLRVKPLASLVSLLAVAVGLASLLGCGSAGTVPFKKSGSPPPADCLKRYNSDPNARVLGKHAYSLSHGSRAARVFQLNKPAYGLRNECAVVYADVESDREYGTLGQFSNRKVWLLISDYPERSERDRIALQRSAAESANVKLNKDGTLTPF